jgi:hypothetical protein
MLINEQWILLFRREPSSFLLIEKEFTSFEKTCSFFRWSRQMQFFWDCCAWSKTKFEPSPSQVPAFPLIYRCSYYVEPKTENNTDLIVGPEKIRSSIISIVWFQLVQVTFIILLYYCYLLILLLHFLCYIISSFLLYID